MGCPIKPSAGCSGRRSVLVLSGRKDGPDPGDRYRTLLTDCHFMFVYDAGRAIGAERPEVLAYIALEFFERRDLFLVSRESGMAFPEGQDRTIRDRPPCAESGHSPSKLAVLHVYSARQDRPNFRRLGSSGFLDSCTAALRAGRVISVVVIDRIRPAREDDATLLPAIERSAVQSFRMVPSLKWITEGDVLGEAVHLGRIRGRRAGWLSMSTTLPSAS